MNSRAKIILAALCGALAVGGSVAAFATWQSVERVNKQADAKAAVYDANTERIIASFERTVATMTADRAAGNMYDFDLAPSLARCDAMLADMPRITPEQRVRLVRARAGLAKLAQPVAAK